MTPPGSAASASTNHFSLAFVVIAALSVGACSAEGDAEIGVADGLALSVPLGDGWLGTNLGNSEAAGGTSTWDGTTMTVAGGGGDFWGQPG